MKHLKYFESDNIDFGISPSSHTGLFDIDNDDCGLELLQEDLTAIREILIDKKYNTYINESIEIYLYDDTLTLINSDSDNEININSKYFYKLLKSIDKFFDNVPDYEQWTGDKFDDSYTQKIVVDDSVRAAKKYNL